MTAGLLASVGVLPFFVGACVLGGFAIWGWRRTRATGALLIAVGAGVGGSRDIVFAWHMMQIYSGRASWRMSIPFTVVEQTGSLIAQVLIIVGLALILRRLPAAKR